MKIVLAILNKMLYSKVMLGSIKNGGKMKNIKILVWYKEGDKYYTEELHNLSPRRYMAGWSFEQLLKYAKEELSWTSIDIDSITAFDIYSDKEHWCQNIRK